MIKKLILLTIFSLSFSSIYAQAENKTQTKEQNLNDTLLTQEDTHLIMFGLSYSTNNTDNKNYLDIKMPTMIADVYFFAKNGIWSSFTYSNFIDASINTYETELSIGFQKYFFDIIDIDFSYKWHQFNGDTLYSGIDYDHGLQLSSGLDFDFINFYVDHSLFFGSSNNYFLDLSLGLNIEFDNVLFKSDNFLIAPTLLSTFGTNNFIYLDIIPRHIRHKGHIINLPPEIIENTESEFIYQNFSVLIPFMYTIGDLSATIAWSYSIPSKRLKEFEWTDQSGLFLSLTYMPNIFK